MAFLLILGTLILALLCYPVLSGVFQICQHYVEARKIGLPILIAPFGPMSVIWALSDSFVTPLIKFLDAWCPIPIFSWIQYTAFGWQFQSRHAIHLKHGPAFLIVSSGETQLHIADASTCDDMLRRIKDFVKPHRMYAALELFGPNVGSVNGDIWARHRRITSPPFNERVSGSVWRESVAQAGGMLDSWLGRARKSGPQGDEGVANLVGDTMLLALHVLTAAGFGKRFEFEGGVQAVSKGHVMSYRDALRTVLQNMYGVIILLSFFMWLPEWMMTANLLMIKTSTQEFRSYMSEMVEEERAGVRLKMEGNDNLMSVLLRASDVEKEGKGRSGLSDEEIYGNLFVYNLAGHDTTANTLAYAITLLATDPKWQEWVGEEITAVFGGKENVEDLEYTEAFPKLKRCMALMYETLRIYGPVLWLPRSTETTQHFTLCGKDYSIPAGTYVSIHTGALHTDPAYWGPDSEIWRPDRFIDSNNEPIPPHPGSFIPWLSGPRICPGKKFAQVEFVAVIARIFKDYRVAPKLMMDECETLSQAQARVKRGVEDSVIKVTLNMKKPEDIRLVWKKKA